MSSGGLRVALVHHGEGNATAAHVRELAAALRDAGHRPVILGARVGRTARAEEDGVEVVRIGRAPERRLRGRGLDSPLTHLPGLLRELAGGRFDAVHAFSPQEACAAALGPAGVVFTAVEPPRREALAERRLRLAFWQRATAPPAVVLVPGEPEQAAMRHWLAVHARIAGPRDPTAHEEVYRSLTSLG